QVRVDAAALARRKAGGENAAGQVLGVGVPDALVVGLRAGATRGDEQLVAQRVEDHAVQRLRPLAQRDRDAPVRDAVEVVAGAVERVDHPGVAAGAAVALLRAAFLAEDGVVGIGPAQLLDDRLLGQAVDLAGVVHAALLGHVQRVEPVHVAHQDVAPGARGLDHDVDGGGEHDGLRGAGGGRARGGKERSGARAGRAVYHSHMSHSLHAAARLRIVLVGTQHPGNIGSAARAIKTMGLRELVLVAPERFPHADAAAMAAGAGDVLDAARRVPTLAEAVADCRLVLGCTARSRRIALEELLPREAAARAVATAAAPAGTPAALVFGRERTGLDNHELQLCHAAVTIPADPDYSSLNLAAAVQVLCYEVRLAMLGLQDAVAPAHAPAPDGDVPA